MASQHLTILGSASQVPTRDRNQNGYALHWEDRLFIFDPGEGTQRQALHAGVVLARTDAIFITHLHGDHCLGLPGVLHRRILDQMSSPVPVFFPAASHSTFDHLMASSLYTETDIVEPHPVASPTVDRAAKRQIAEFGPLRVSAAPLHHPVPTFGYRFDERPRRHLDPVALDAAGIEGAQIGELERAGRLTTDRGRFELDSFSTVVPGPSMAFVLDTALCESAIELAADVDLLVCEATYLHDDQRLARPRGHMTAREAGWLARESGARRVVLTHFSRRYGDVPDRFAAEAGELHDDVVVASDLVSIPFPSRVGHASRTRSP